MIEKVFSMRPASIWNYFGILLCQIQGSIKEDRIRHVHLHLVHTRHSSSQFPSLKAKLKNPPMPCHKLLLLH